MSRPIPEGVEPCEQCGGTGHDGFDRSYPPNPYICEDCDGTGIEPETKKERCPKCHQTTTDGICGLCEVLLKPYIADPDREILTGEQPDKDALIRGLMGALEEIRKPDELVEANDAFAIHALRRIQAQAQHALTLARTTCPEAFEV